MPDWIDTVAKKIADLGGDEQPSLIARLIREAYQRHISDPKPVMARYTVPAPTWVCFPQQDVVNDPLPGRSLGDGQ
jgi:hypothetical protein